MAERSDLHYYELLTAALSEQPRIGNVLLKEYFSTHTFADILDEGAFLIRKKHIQVSSLEQRAKEIDALLVKYNVHILPIWSDKYPESLKQTYDPPVCLYYRGDVENLANQSISIVGTRRVTRYGITTTNQLVEGLVERNFTVVSGMAMGIDAEAHRSTIKNGGKTIAVLVGGPHKATPAVNSKIYEAILKTGGLIISENLPGTTVYAAMFPSRNRIVAGLSSGTVVIEADVKSGSLITAELAVEYGKDVFAVPGPIGSKQSQGTNSLIKKGHAKLLQSVNDIFDEMGMETLSIKNKSLKQNLTPTEVSIYDLLLEGSKTLDELQILLSIDRGVILSLCTRFEFKDIIYRDISGRYNLV